ncbi:2-oxoacid:acceptor oxidoreductase family protein [Methylomarinum sp. Ch1-1]|uniref:2-oxoacid:acceptor oxidoreductase family protein n=1 Tax=Methylomarinum roseum TaxID=3067653 RepID=A0AAU7NSQ7_9GAMM|nr:2-oxoacid:acceptor oxidoreductase family protein [Methylomarinum sp. Ch1-1]MDP4519975.1 2-oxoacid:acceptor oxidoreductase family protein [Methylomarinum sp. Ch1-1]
MFTIRFHGRGGQGMKTASHMLGNAFFMAGFEVQDAPRYGAERRGAPMTAYVRADKQDIYARGIIRKPGLVVVADDSLVPVAAAGVMSGFTAETVLLIVSREGSETWRQRLNISSPVKVLTPLTSKLPLVSAACAGAAASLCGKIEVEQLIEAVKQALTGYDDKLIEINVDAAVRAFEVVKQDRGIVKQLPESSASDYARPDWIELPLETADRSAPVIHAAQTSVKVRTGLWRTRRPVIDEQRCNQCWWICSSSCPDSAINIDAQNRPVIDYEHCKGCMICVAQCPAHAIESIPEAQAQQEEKT